VAKTLNYARAEPKTLRRGYTFRVDLTLQEIESDGDIAAVNLSGYTITPLFTTTEAKDGASGGTVSATTVSAAAGTFYVSMTAANTLTLTAGKEYWWHVYVSHATDTSGLDVLYKIGKVYVTP
jgi:hypothetical protein